MSWSVSGTYGEGDFSTMKEQALSQNPECGDQFDAAGNAVSSLIESGTLGAGEFAISMVGHSNPEHKPRAGYANDFVTITVAQLGRAE